MQYNYYKKGKMVGLLPRVFNINVDHSSKKEELSNSDLQKNVRFFFLWPFSAKGKSVSPQK